MPTKTLFDLSGIDLNHVIVDQAGVRKVNPHRDHMEHLNGIVWIDTENARIIGFKDVRPDEFWVSGHIPGNPILPGVLMLEAGAQMASFYTREYIGWKGFIAFSGLEDVRFRQQVSPGVRLYLVGHILWHRHRRIACKVQGLVKGELVFEATIIGMEL